MERPIYIAGLVFIFTALILTFAYRGSPIHIAGLVLGLTASILLFIAAQISKVMKPNSKKVIKSMAVILFITTIINIIIFTTLH